MKRTILLTLCGAVCAMAGASQASIIGNPITVTVQNGSGTGTFSVSLADCTYDPSSHGYFYSQQTSRPVTDDSGRNMGTFNGLSMFMLDDPSISLGFAFQSASSTPTLITISSGLLTFGALNNPTAHSSAGMTITDNTLDGTGVTMHGNSSGPFAYQANYNGLVPAGSLYSLHCPDFNSLGDGSSNSENANNNAGISGSVSSISSSWSFVITPGDSVSGTSNFSVTPAPGALALLGIGGLAVSRRRR